MASHKYPPDNVPVVATEPSANPLRSKRLVNSAKQLLHNFSSFRQRDTIPTANVTKPQKRNLEYSSDQLGNHSLTARRTSAKPPTASAAR